MVDEDGRVLRTATRAEVRSGNLRHRTVMVLVRASDGRLLVHRRADHKDVWPGRWDLCVGGVVGAGEDVDIAAARELAEEVGVASPLTRLGEGAYEGERVRELVTAYSTTSDGPFAFDDGEVVEVAWVAPADLDAWLAAHDVVPDTPEVVRPLL